MRKLILFLLITAILSNFAIAGEIAHGEIKNASQYSQLQELKTKANNFLANQKQPADMFGFEYFPTSDIVIFWGQKQILMNIDVVMNAYSAGKIDLIGTIKYNRKGYIGDSEFDIIKSRFNELREIENSYEYDVSTLIASNVFDMEYNIAEEVNEYRDDINNLYIEIKKLNEKIEKVESDIGNEIIDIVESVSKEINGVNKKITEIEKKLIMNKIREVYHKYFGKKENK